MLIERQAQLALKAHSLSSLRLCVRPSQTITCCLHSSSASYGTTNSSFSFYKTTHLLIQSYLLKINKQQRRFVCETPASPYHHKIDQNPSPKWNLVKRKTQTGIRDIPHKIASIIIFNRVTYFRCFLCAYHMTFIILVLFTRI